MHVISRLSPLITTYFNPPVDQEILSVKAEMAPVVAPQNNHVGFMGRTLTTMLGTSAILGAALPAVSNAEGHISQAVEATNQGLSSLGVFGMNPLIATFGVTMPLTAILLGGAVMIAATTITVLPMFRETDAREVLSNSELERNDKGPKNNAGRRAEVVLKTQRAVVAPAVTDRFKDMDVLRYKKKYLLIKKLDPTVLNFVIRRLKEAGWQEGFKDSLVIERMAANLINKRFPGIVESTRRYLYKGEPVWISPLGTEQDRNPITEEERHCLDIIILLRMAAQKMGLKNVNIATDHGRHNPIIVIGTPGNRGKASGRAIDVFSEAHKRV